MREIKFCVIKKEVSPTIPETPLFDLLFPKEGKLGHAKVGAAVGQKAFDFHRPDGGAGSGKGGGAAVAAFPCYRHTGHQKGNGSAFWREREVLNGLFLHCYFRTGEAVCPGRGGINFIIAVREFTPGNVCVYYWEVLQSFLRETGDPRIFGNGDVFEQYPHSKIGMHAWAHYLAGDFQPQTY